MSRATALCASLTAVLAAAALGGCANPLADYETLTAKTATDLDSKTQQYIRDTNALDAVRENEQRTAEQRILNESASVTMRLNAMGLTGDPRQPLVGKLQDSGAQYVAARLQQPSAAVALTSPKAPNVADVVKALDQLAREPKAADQAKELAAYFKEVYGDLKKDQTAKAAEKKVSAAGAATK
jgi:hypothetical protein